MVRAVCGTACYERRFGARVVLRTWIAAEKFERISGAAEPPRASDLSREALLTELELPENARLIGVVGRLTPEKRVKDLIWAADLLRVLHDNLRLLVIG